MEVGNIYTDSCPSVALDPPVGPTVDDLASAWADLPAFDATAPTRHHRRRVRRQAGRVHGPRLRPASRGRLRRRRPFHAVGGRRRRPADGYWAQGTQPASPTVDPRRRRHPCGDRRHVVPGHLGRRTGPTSTRSSTPSRSGDGRDRSSTTSREPIGRSSEPPPNAVATTPTTLGTTPFTMRSPDEAARLVGSRGGLIMTVDPTPSVRPGRPARHAVRAMAMATVAAITIAACSSGTTDEPTAASTQEPTGSATTPPLTATPVDATTDTSGSGTATGSSRWRSGHVHPAGRLGQHRLGRDQGGPDLRAALHGGRQHLHRLLPVGRARPAGRSDR